MFRRVLGHCGTARRTVCYFIWPSASAPSVPVYMQSAIDVRVAGMSGPGDAELHHHSLLPPSLEPWRGLHA